MENDAAAKNYNRASAGVNSPNSLDSSLANNQVESVRTRSEDDAVEQISTDKLGVLETFRIQALERGACFAPTAGHVLSEMMCQISIVHRKWSPRYLWIRSCDFYDAKLLRLAVKCYELDRRELFEGKLSVCLAYMMECARIPDSFDRDEMALQLMHALDGKVKYPVIQKDAPYSDRDDVCLMANIDPLILQMMHLHEE